MKPGLLFFIVTIVGGVWAFTPRPGDEATTPAASDTRYMSSSNPWAKDHVAAVTTPSPRSRPGSSDGGSATLTRRDDGHFYAQVSVGGRGTEMLVDTGASVVALTGEDARTLGVDWNDSEVTPVARSASGTVYGVPVKLDRVQLGEVEVHDVEAIVVPKGLPISLLGQSFLGRVGRVEIADDRMVLGG